MAYELINFTNSCGADDLNKMDRQILENSKMGSNSSNGLARKQTINMAKALKKLRSNEATEICFMGDSVFYAYDQNSADKVAETCIPDNGSPLEGYYRSSVTIYDSFMDVINKVYENNVTLKKKIYTGQSVQRANKEWNASNSDFIIINYGINDAMGGHISSSYKGKIDLFIEEYRKLIEREIANGTAVILLSPTKLLAVEGMEDIDNRTLLDVYEQAVKNLASEYICPYIDGNEMIQNFGSDLSIDFCHFTKEGWRAIGYRLASILIGQSPLYPMTVFDGSYLGVNPQLDNVNIVKPCILESADSSPNIASMMSSGDLDYPITNPAGGLQVNLSGRGLVTWSFYCPHDGMVVIPSVKSETVGATIKMNLDFGATQGKWVNEWNRNMSETIDRNYNEPSIISITDDNLNSSKIYGLHMINETSPVLKITSKGWHTLTLQAEFPKTKARRVARSIIPDEPGVGNIVVYGLDFLSLNSYNMKMKIQAIEKSLIK